MLDGTQPGILFSSKLTPNKINWPAPWSPTKGLLNNLTDPASTNPLSTPPEIYYVSSFTDSTGPNAFQPTPLPPGTEILVNRNNTRVFDAVTGAELPTRYIGSNDAIMVWIPGAEFRGNTGQSVLVQYAPTSTVGVGGQPNFGMTETWEPGYQEACNFATSSLGIGASRMAPPHPIMTAMP